MSKVNNWGEVEPPAVVTKFALLSAYFKVPLTPLGEGDLGGEGHKKKSAHPTRYTHPVKHPDFFMLACFRSPLFFYRLFNILFS